MQQFMIGESIPPQAILDEARCTGTRQNALHMKPIVEGLPGKRVVITSEFHILRAYRAFRKVGVQVLPRPITGPLKSSSRWEGCWNGFLESSLEMIKIAFCDARVGIKCVAFVLECGVGG